MTQLSGFPSSEVRFDKDSGVVGGSDDVLALAADKTITDLVVLSHGWNDEPDDARRLYTKLTGSVRAVLDHGYVPGLGDRKIGVAAVIWPSKKFGDTELAAGAVAAAAPIDGPVVLEQIEGLREVFPEPAAQRTLDSVAALVPQLPDSATARANFADQLRSLLDPAGAAPEDGPTELLELGGGELMDRLAIPVSIAPPQGMSGSAAVLGSTVDDVGATGGAAGLPSLLGGVWGAARNMLNYATYYVMKARAGAIGERGLAPILVRAHQARPELRIHLAGHSFGGRLVSAATRALPTGSLASLTLLQAAFSHYGFSGNWEPGQAGYFRGVVADHKVNGPILITNTANDMAVGIAYAIASRIAGQVATMVGDVNDIYGGIGRNGAQRTGEAVRGELLAVGGNYAWKPRTPHNLLADKFIASHSDVTGQQVAYALLSAISST